jgi:hypothetical protein
MRVRLVDWMKQRHQFMWKEMKLIMVSSLSYRMEKETGIQFEA